MPEKPARLSSANKPTSLTLAYDLFEHADPGLLAWIRENAKSTLIEQESCIVQEGDLADGLYIVEHGMLRIETSRADGEIVLLAEQGSGSLVGEMSFLEQRPAVARVLAQAGSRLLHLSREMLSGLESDAHPAAAPLYRTIGTKLSMQIQSQNSWIHRFPASEQEPLRKVLVLFAELNEQDVEWLRQLGSLQRLPAGGLLLDQGQPVEVLYLILAGEARIQIHSDTGLRVVGSSRRGEVLGEMTLLNESASGASARVDTLEGLELLAMDIKALETALALDAARATRFWRALARMLSQRSRDQLIERGLAAVSRQSEMQADSEEIEIGQMSAITTAGVRFDWLCRQFQSR